MTPTHPRQPSFSLVVTKPPFVVVGVGPEVTRLEHAGDGEIAEVRPTTVVGELEGDGELVVGTDHRVDEARVDAERLGVARVIVLV